MIYISDMCKQTPSRKNNVPETTCILTLIHVSVCARCKRTFPGLNSSVFWVIKRRKLVQNRRFGTTCRSHL